MRRCHPIGGLAGLWPGERWSPGPRIGPVSPPTRPDRGKTVVTLLKKPVLSLFLSVALHSSLSQAQSRTSVMSGALCGNDRARESGSHRKIPAMLTRPLRRPLHCLARTKHLRAILRDYPFLAMLRYRKMAFVRLRRSGCARTRIVTRHGMISCGSLSEGALVPDRWTDSKTARAMEDHCQHSLKFFRIAV